MASNEERLGVIIETELRGGGMSAAAKEMQEFTQTTDRASKVVVNDLNKIQSSLNKTTASLKTMGGGGGDAFNKLNKGAISASVGVQKLGNSAGRNAQAMNGLNNIVRDLPFGFIAIQNNITQVADALLGFGAAAAAVSFGLSIIVTGITAAIQKYGSLSNAIDAVTKNTNYQKKAQEDLATALLDGNKEAQEEIINLQRLFDVSKNISIPMNQRIAAINKLKEEFPQYKNDLTNEALLAGKATEAYDKLKTSLIESARARALAERAAANAAKDLDLEVKGLEIAKQLADVNEELNKRQQIQKRLAGTPGAGVSPRDAILAAQQTLLQRDLNDVFRERTALLQQIDQIQKQLGNTGAGIVDPTKTKKDAKTVGEILKELQKDLLTVDVTAQALGGTFVTLGNDKLRAFEKAIKDLVDIGVQPTDNLFQQLRKRAEEIQAFLKPQKIPTPPKITIPSPLIEMAPLQSTAIRGLTDTFAPQINELTKEINEITEHAIQNGIVDIFASFGEALATGDTSSILKAFANGIGNYLGNLGKVLIATGLGIEAFKKSLKSLQGIPAIIAGGVMIATAGIFKGLASGGIGSFATGGTANGSQLAVVGDNAQRREHIHSDQQLMTLADELNRKRGGGSNGDAVEAVLRGETIYFAYNRYARSIGLIQ